MDNQQNRGSLPADSIIDKVTIIEAMPPYKAEFWYSLGET